MQRKKFNVLAKHLQEVMEESLPKMVDDRVKEHTKTQVPLYVVEGLIMERKHNQADVAKMIANAIQQERENFQAEITSQINNAITNHIPSQNFSPYARYSIEHWKNPHANIFYIKRQKELRKPKEEVYSNSKIVQFIKSKGDEHQYHIDQIQNFLKNDINFSPYARYSIEHWKNPHAKIFYIKRQKELRKPKEEVYSNSKIVQFIKSKGNYTETGLMWSLSVFIRSTMIWERLHDFQLGVESYQQKVNLTAPKITFPCIEKYKMFSIVTEPVYRIIYKSSEKEKRVMRHQEDHKFCDATLKKVLKGLKRYNNDVKHGYVTLSLSKEDAEGCPQKYVMEVFSYAVNLEDFGGDLYINEGEEYIGVFLTDGLLHVGKKCSGLGILSLETSFIDDNGGKWVHELALHNKCLELLNYFLTPLVNYDYDDLVRIVKNYSESLVSLKIRGCPQKYVMEVFSYAVNLEDFGGDLYINEGEEYIGVKFPLKMQRLTWNHGIQLEELYTKYAIGDFGLQVARNRCRMLRKIKIESSGQEGL
nr:hypothetical protein [Tanacetum cinerariifolium]